MWVRGHLKRLLYITESKDQALVLPKRLFVILLIIFLLLRVPPLVVITSLVAVFPFFIAYHGMLVSARGMNSKHLRNEFTDFKVDQPTEERCTAEEGNLIGNTAEGAGKCYILHSILSF